MVEVIKACVVSLVLICIAIIDFYYFRKRKKNGKDNT